MSDARLKSFIDRVLRLKEEQDALADDIREVYAEAKGEGFDKTAMGEVVAYLRKIEKKGRDAVHERGAMFDLYLSTYEASGTRIATHTHAPASYSEAKGRGDAVGKTDAISFDPETGELTDNQESGCSYSEASISAVSPASDESETDDVGATASSTNSASPAAIPLGAANSAGEAPSSSPASPARHSDDDIPAFIKQAKPDCLKLKDGHCRLSFATSALCAECNQRRAMARALA